MEDPDFNNYLPVISIGEVLFDVFPDSRRIGGAPFNFASQLNSLGIPVEFVSSVGADAMGDDILAYMKSRSMSCEGICINKLKSTGEVQVTVDENGSPSYNIIKDRAWDWISATKHVERLIDEGVSVIYFGSLAQRSQVSMEAIRSLVGRAGSKILKLCDINLRQDYYNRSMIEWCLNAGDVIKLNDEELIELCNLLDLKSESSISRALVEGYNLRCLCVTNGAKGSELHFPDRESIYISLEGVSNNSDFQIIDTVGAGDAFTAMLCAGYLKGMTWEKMLHCASSFAAEICSIRGALPDDIGFYTSFKDKLEGSYNV